MKSLALSTTMISYDCNLKLGLLGGGQLARMLAQEAANLGLQVHVLSEKKEDPAAQVCGQHFIGSPDSEKDLQEFCAQVQLLTFESEFFDVDHLEHIQSQSELKVFPSTQCMRLLQDRNTQKQALVQAKIPTADFMLVNDQDSFQKAFQHFKGEFVLKKCRGGYDGYGTYFIRSEDDLKKYHGIFPENFIAEDLVRFKKELAVILARNTLGECIALPLVETQQSSSRCDWVVGPRKHPGLNALLTKLKKFLQQIDYVGVIAFELFETSKGLIVNEVAPRVHNSGHYSQEALTQSQFLLHLQCGLGLPLTAPRLRSKAFCMVNLLGQSDQEILLSPCSGRLHWYGKNQNRPGRKMGHINYTGASIEKLLTLARKERKAFRL